ncbi:MAG: peroxiredoxin [Candidatus Melainabacteria bacterium]|nr:peroxiredoxin [Candidatus Melainabacteria bacterium]
MTIQQIRLLIFAMIALDVAIIALFFFTPVFDDFKSKLNLGKSNAQATPKITLAIGNQAPLATVFQATGEHTSLALQQALAGKQSAILVFYPMDNTPLCTIQLCALRDNYQAVLASGTAVLGVNPAGLNSHKKFAEQHHYPFPILVDENRQLGKALGIGELFGANDRTVVILDATGKVTWFERGNPSVKSMMAHLPKA